MTQTLVEYARRPQRAVQADGLNDVIGGIGLLAVTAMQFAGFRFQATIQGYNFAQTPAYRNAMMVWLLSIIGMFAVIFLSKRGASILRDQFVYPRMGYVAQSTRTQEQRRPFAIGAALGLVMLISLVGGRLPRGSGFGPLWNSTSLLVTLGLVGTLSYLFYFAKLGFVRHLVLAVISTAVSLLLAMRHDPILPAIATFVVLLGISLIIAGGAAFAGVVRIPLIGEDDTQ